MDPLETVKEKPVPLMPGVKVVGAMAASVTRCPAPVNVIEAVLDNAWPVIVTVLLVEMVTALVIRGSALVSAIVVTAGAMTIVSPELALSIAARNVPAPLSFDDVTTKVA